jgi:competence protein ComEC
MGSNRTVQLFILVAILLVIGWGVVFWLSSQGPTQVAAPPASSEELLLAVLDVGQGDSIFVRSPSGETMLVDAGNSRADVEEVIIPYLTRLGISRLDFLVLTHPDQDHVGGMPVLLQAIDVGSFVDPVQPGTTNRAYAQTLTLVRDRQIKAIRARKGRTVIELGPLVKVEVLAPEDPLIASGSSVSNNNSVVLRLVHGSVAALLTGDAEKEAEERMLVEPATLRSDILKVAHHGSRFTSTTPFLDAVRPQIGLISAGAGNSYGHPHQELLDRLEKRNIKVYRTDQHGTIEVRSDGRSYTVAPEKRGS